MRPSLFDCTGHRPSLHDDDPLEAAKQGVDWIAGWIMAFVFVGGLLAIAVAIATALS